MNKLIEYAINQGYRVTIEKRDEFTQILVTSNKGHFRHNGLNSLSCGFWPEDEKDELNDIMERLRLGLYQHC